MLRWLKADAERAKTTETFRNISDGLQEIYRDKLLPIEEYYDFHRFYSAPLTPADFTAKPMVMLIGQYSTGKTTFIRHLLERDYPGMRIGPEPTTDKFCCIMDSSKSGGGDHVIPGNALVVDRTLPFTQLSQFGNGFMNRFEASMMEGSPVLQGVTFIDTPGILSGEKQRLQRGYDFEGVVNWFADRVDMILLLFDAHKLDISDEFRRCILACGQNENKIRIVLNKSDMVTTQQLMRVYGALMWSLGKVINTPETSRVFIGSFWDEKLNNDEQRNLFEKEESDLYADIAKLPEEAALRKLNDLIKRARLAKTHACLMTYIKHEMPSMFGKNSKKRELIEHLDEVYEQVSKRYNLPIGDFPSVDYMRKELSHYDFSKIKKARSLEPIDEILSNDIPALLKMIPRERDAMELPDIFKAGIANPGEASPWADDFGAVSWLSGPPDISEYMTLFESLGPDPADGKITGAQAKQEMLKSKLPSGVLHKIWNLADVDRDGKLDINEFALAMHFVRMRLDGHSLPHELPENMIPK
ncbi:hypothetical protein FOZ60_003749 [Perkinsus olseni]|uniref:EH domain-containing protein 1 n=1 Tax=Perkinsus olseni TaxID=32597 RepID=A0A7J6PHS7_PEROL|nr:hypothetical protein FOZ60_012870 [Perkinsus olseni]KAF4695738.1 hypothetical protein FOZ60_003749 [Perkinsus olseni]